MFYGGPKQIENDEGVVNEYASEMGFKEIECNFYNWNNYRNGRVGTNLNNIFVKSFAGYAAPGTTMTMEIYNPLEVPYNIYYRYMNDRYGTLYPLKEYDVSSGAKLIKAETLNKTSTSYLMHQTYIPQLENGDNLLFEIDAELGSDATEIMLYHSDDRHCIARYMGYPGQGRKKIQIVTSAMRYNDQREPSTMDSILIYIGPNKKTQNCTIYGYKLYKLTSPTYATSNRDERIQISIPLAARKWGAVKGDINQYDVSIYVESKDVFYIDENRHQCIYRYQLDKARILYDYVRTYISPTGYYFDKVFDYSNYAKDGEILTCGNEASAVQMKPEIPTKTIHDNRTAYFVEDNMIVYKDCVIHSDKDFLDYERKLNFNKFRGTPFINPPEDDVDNVDCYTLFNHVSIIYNSYIHFRPVKAFNHNHEAYLNNVGHDMSHIYGQTIEVINDDGGKGKDTLCIGNPPSPVVGQYSPCNLFKYVYDDEIVNASDRICLIELVNNNGDNRPPEGDVTSAIVVKRDFGDGMNANMWGVDIKDYKNTMYWTKYLKYVKLWFMPTSFIKYSKLLYDFTKSSEYNKIESTYGVLTIPRRIGNDYVDGIRDCIYKDFQPTLFQRTYLRPIPLPFRYVNFNPNINSITFGGLSTQQNMFTVMMNSYFPNRVELENVKIGTVSSMIKRDINIGTYRRGSMNLEGSKFDQNINTDNFYTQTISDNFEGNYSWLNYIKDNVRGFYPFDYRGIIEASKTIESGVDGYECKLKLFSPQSHDLHDEYDKYPRHEITIGSYTEFKTDKRYHPNGNSRAITSYGDIRCEYHFTGSPYQNRYSGTPICSEERTDGHKQVTTFFRSPDGNYLVCQSLKRGSAVGENCSIRIDSPSDVSTKNSIVRNNNSMLNKISNINFYDYYYNDDNRRVINGVMANQLRDIDENFVRTNVGVDDEKELLYPDNDALLMAALKSIKELNEKINKLEKEIEELRGGN